MTFATNLLLALLWAMLIGPFSPANLVVGFIVGYIILRLIGAGSGRERYVRRAAAVARLVAYTTIELLRANVRVATYTLGRLDRLRPAVLEVPVRADLTDAEITLLANLITLTPGTLTLDVDRKRRSLFVHFMHVDDAGAAIASIREGFELRILEVTR